MSGCHPKKAPNQSHPLSSTAATRAFKYCPGTCNCCDILQGVVNGHCAGESGHAASGRAIGCHTLANNQPIDGRVIDIRASPTPDHFRDHQARHTISASKHDANGTFPLLFVGLNHDFIAEDNDRVIEKQVNFTKANIATRILFWESSTLVTSQGKIWSPPPSVTSITAWLPVALCRAARTNFDPCLAISFATTRLIPLIQPVLMAT